MNIAFIVLGQVDSATNGVGRITINLADCFAAHGHDVCFISKRKGNGGTCTDTRQHFFPSLKFASKDNEKFLLNFLKQRHVNFVIFQDGDGDRVPFPCIYKKAGTRLIVAVHNTPDWFKQHIKSKVFSKRISKIMGLFKSFRKKRKIINVYKFNAKFADKIVLLSPSYVPMMAEYIDPADREKLVPIPNFSSEIPSGLSIKKKKEILFIGRLSNVQKRVDLLLIVWSKLQERFPDWTLRIVGDGSDRNPLEKLAKELGLSHVFFEGVCNEPQNYYRDAAVLALTSFYEGFPMVLIEGQSFGCVPVVFDSFSAVHDIVEDGVSGVLVPAFDLECYAEKLSELMSNPEYREGLALNAQKSVSRFSPEKIVGQWEKLFQEVLEKDKNYPHELVAKIQGMGEAGL